MHVIQPGGNRNRISASEVFFFFLLGSFSRFKYVRQHCSNFEIKLFEKIRSLASSFSANIVLLDQAAAIFPNADKIFV